MKIDITLKISQKMAEEAKLHEKKALVGHLGTHFDIMNKEFPLEYTQRDAIIFDVSSVTGKDIDIDDVHLSLVESGMFVTFYTGFIERKGYGTNEYFTEHPQLSHELIRKLLEKEISIIGIDFAGVRRGQEHVAADQLCADNQVFVIENLCHLHSLLGGQSFAKFTANTYPVNYEGVTGLPCRVIAEV